MLDEPKKLESILLICVDVDKMMLQIDVNRMASTLSEDELVRAINFDDCFFTSPSAKKAERSFGQNK